MRFEPVVGELKSHEPKDVCRLIYDFFKYQHEFAVRACISASSHRTGAESANRTAKERYNENEDDFKFGGIELPYNESSLAQLKEVELKAEKAESDAKALLDFVINKIIEGFVDTSGN